MVEDSKETVDEKVIVTGALPYANGPIHIGHLAGAYLPGDIYTRYLKKKGIDVIYICGTDEHGVPITLSAEKKGIPPQELVEHYHKEIKKDFRNLGIEFDNFSGTAREIHHKLAQDFFLNLLEKGYIKPITTEELYCPECKKFLPDRYVEGVCPYCGYENARGDSCESCGAWLETDRLIEPRCALCGTSPEKKETRHWYLLLDKFQKKLEKWIESKKWKKTVKRYLKGWLDEGLRPRPITRDLEWGIPVPLDYAKGKVLYVWFENTLGYISSTIEWADKIGDKDRWIDYWKGENSKLVHFIGKDNIVFHGIIWPAVLIGYGEYNLPAEIPANEYLNLEGSSMSTSRDWAVWIDDFLRKFRPDYLRYYLSLISPETRDSEFKWEEFQERVNSELINIFANFINRTLKFIEKYHDRKIPEPSTLEEGDKEMLENINKQINIIDDSLSKFRVRRAVRSFIEIAAIGNRYYDSMEPWLTRKNDIERTATTIYLCSHIIYILANIGEIFIPFGSEDIYSMLNLKSVEWDSIKDVTVPVNHPIQSVNPLYEKIEDDEIEEQIRRLKMTYVNIEDFKEMGLKVGVIEEVEDMEGADKLYKLTVDTGEKRTLVAGIKGIYIKEDLIGMRIIVITNLEPATIMGVKSEGMLLAATEGNEVSIISPDKEITPGSPVL